MSTHEQRMARARRSVPQAAPLIDVLAVAYRADDDLESVAADLWAKGVTEHQVRLALAALVLAGVISGQTDWPADVPSALAWAYTHNPSITTPLPRTEE